MSAAVGFCSDFGAPESVSRELRCARAQAGQHPPSEGHRDRQILAVATEK